MQLKEKVNQVGDSAVNYAFNLQLHVRARHHAKNEMHNHPMVCSLTLTLSWASLSFLAHTRTVVSKPMQVALYISFGGYVKTAFMQYGPAGSSGGPARNWRTVTDRSQARHHTLLVNARDDRQLHLACPLECHCPAAAGNGRVRRPGLPTLAKAWVLGENWLQHLCVVLQRLFGITLQSCEYWSQHVVTYALLLVTCMVRNITSRDRSVSILHFEVTKLGHHC